MDIENILEETKGVKEEQTLKQRKKKMYDRIRRKFKPIDVIKAEEIQRRRESEERAEERKRQKKERDAAKSHAKAVKNRKKLVKKCQKKYRRVHRAELNEKRNAKYKSICVMLDRDLGDRFVEYLKSHGLTQREVFQTFVKDYLEKAEGATKES